ncbi:MAG: SMC-Scp complex subunit ScpB [Nitrospinae bacterium]|nr:SMC-Scp complex subunit ScpB [Nitrospinota bacterium]
MEREELKAIVENILLASDQPVTPDDLQSTLMNGTEKAELRSLLQELQEEYQSRNLRIDEVAGGYQLCTRTEYSDWVRKFLKLDKTTKLSQPSLDTLSIIAYKQPLTKQEVEEIRGVDCGGVIRTLLDKKIVALAGRKKVPGRPIMYRTTRKFLEYFGLKDLADLPTLEDLQDELQGELESNVQEEMDFNTSREQNPSPEGGVEDSIQPVNEDPPRIIVPEKKSSSSNEEDAVSPSSANDLDPGV